MDTLFYEGFMARDSLLANDSLLFRQPENYLAGQWGMSVEYVPEALHSNDGVALFLLGFFFLSVVVVLLRKTSFSERVNNFVYPQSIQTNDVLNSGEEFVQMLLAVMVSMLGAVLYFGYASLHWNLHLAPFSMFQLLGIYAGVCLGYLILKQQLLACVNAVFFKHEKRELWRKDYGLVFSIGALLLFFLVLLAVYVDLTQEKVAYGLLFVLLFVKSLVFLKDFTYFFDKIYGVVHLFVYFCALEAVPLLVLWTALNRLTNYLTTTYY